MVRAYLSIGSNIGDRFQNLQSAVQMLTANDLIQVTRVSSIYETEPVGGVVQDDFLNIAVAIETTLSADELLAYLHQIEQKLLRQRIVHWGPRTIDLDILYYANESRTSGDLILPHPEIGNRKFVLVPLQEVAQDDSNLLQNIQHMLEVTPDTTTIVKTDKFGEL